MAPQVLDPYWGRSDMLGLVLTAGGARGAYQAGGLKRVGELRSLRKRPCPFEKRSEVGGFYFGDGGLRLVNPFSPAIRLGATRVFAVGIRCHRSADDLSHAELVGLGDLKPVMGRPPLSQICGVFMNAGGLPPVLPETPESLAWDTKGWRATAFQISRFAPRATAGGRRTRCRLRRLSPLPTDARRGLR